MRIQWPQSCYYPCGWIVACGYRLFQTGAQASLHRQRERAKAMNPLILNVLAVLAALVMIYTVWIGVHLLARKRMGERKLGCQGPSYDLEGNSVCCRTGEACDKEVGTPEK